TRTTRPATYTSSWAITADCLKIPTSCSCSETRSSGERVNEEIPGVHRARSRPASLRQPRVCASRGPTGPTAQSAAVLLAECRGGSHALRGGGDEILCRSSGQTFVSRGGNQQLGGHERREPEAVQAGRLAQRHSPRRAAAGFPALHGERRRMARLPRRRLQ